MSFLQGGSPSNYTIGGARFWFSRLVDETATPPTYEGFRDMGNVVDSSQEQTIEELDHFSAKTGTRRKDRSLVTEISEEIVFTLDELSTENIRSFFRAGAVTNGDAVNASPSAWVLSTAYAVGDWVEPTTPAGYVYKCTTAGTSDITEPSPWDTTPGGTTTDNTVTWTTYAVPTVTDEVMQLVATQLRILGNGYNAANVVVKDITGVTTYTVTTDYTLETISPGGYIGIKRVAGGTIADGEFVRVAYDYDTRERKIMYPATILEVIGQALFFGVSDTGNEFIRSFAKAQIEPEGAFELDDEDWSTFQLRLKILDNSDAVATAPFGVLEHLGTGQDI
jgi:hypothetical protein